MLLGVGRHSITKKRRNPSVYLVSALAPAAVFMAATADTSPVPVAVVEPEPVAAPAAPVVEQPEVPCCVEVVAAPSLTPPPVLLTDDGSADVSPASLVSASRWRVVSRTLPAGVAPETGLQVRTILTARSVSAVFPEINNIGGVRQDALRWHPDGLALDVMIPNPSSDAGIALGNQIVAYVLNNAKRFGIQDAIWRGVYYTPGGAKSGGYGHYDHVHITTTGGGYPDGDELYFR
ncbi:Conserved exported protein of uncharacterised function [Mycolicibacterium aurum]|uniref:Conserved exported protein of uncharacterized function n=1 Tax=Mycolicibacterium aurum TaxID=1791 RepID=A0A3S5EJW8_MYCAU|nr:Conserved exported protein of uncharacterised function [Mycolicibacterium aurum]